MQNGLKTIHIGNGRSKNGFYYQTTDSFLESLGNGSLREGYGLEENVFLEIAERLNRGEKELAQQIVDNGVLIAINATNRKEIDGLIALAEVCCGG